MGRGKRNKAPHVVIVPASTPSTSRQTSNFFLETGTVHTGVGEKSEWNVEKHIYERNAYSYEMGDFAAALKYYNQALLSNPSDVKLRKERDKCKLLLGQLITPDFVEEPLKKTGMTQCQMVAYWRSDAAINGENELSSCFRELAKRSIPSAEEQILVNGYRALYGWGEAKNPELAVEFFKTAVQRGHDMIVAEAKYILGVIWIFGPESVSNQKDGIAILENVAFMSPHNPADAISHYRRIGVAEAQCALGAVNFLNSSQGSNDFSFQLAAFWFEKAQMNGSFTAQAWLGFMYLNGLGVPKNEIMTECFWKKALNSTKCNEAQIYLTHLYLSQMEVLSADAVINKALESDDEMIKDVSRGLVKTVQAKYAERKAVQRDVDIFEKEHKLNKHTRISFRERILRAQQGSREILKAREIYTSCKGKFSVAVGALNEYVKKNKASDATVVDIISKKFLDDLAWRSAAGAMEATAMLEMLLNLSRLLNLLLEYQYNISVYVENKEIAESMVNLFYRVMEYEPYYMKWQIFYAELIYKILRALLSAKFKMSETFRKRVKISLALMGSMIDPGGEGFKFLINAWTYFDDVSMPTRSLGEFYYRNGDFNRTHVVLQEGLERFPHHLGFLYLAGMTCLRNESDVLMGPYNMKLQAVQHLQIFLKDATRDHPRIPEAYYLLGKFYYEICNLSNKPRSLCFEIVKHFLKMGKLAEDSQLLCFTPYQSFNRNLLEMVLENEFRNSHPQESEMSDDQKMVQIVEQLFSDFSVDKSDWQVGKFDPDEDSSDQPMVVSLRPDFTSQTMKSKK